jgi:hypothetical protein
VVGVTAPRLERRYGAFVLVLESGAEYVVKVPDAVMLVEIPQAAPLYLLDMNGESEKKEPAGSAYPKDDGTVVFLLWDSWRQIAFSMEHLKRLMLCMDGASVKAVAEGSA